MPLKVLPMEESDVTLVTPVIFAAFDNDPFHCAVFPRVHYNSLHAWFSYRLAELLKDRNLHCIKIVDTDIGPNAIVAYGRWEFPHADEVDAEQQTQDAPKKHQDDSEKKKLEFPEHANKRLFDEYLGLLHDSREVLIDKYRDYVCMFLATHPSHQGKGAGSLMIRYGLDAADREHAKAFIDATPAGYPVYLQHGWKDLENPYVDFDLKEYGVVNGTMYRNVRMVRERR